MGLATVSDSSPFGPLTVTILAVDGDGDAGGHVDGQRPIRDISAHHT